MAVSKSRTSTKKKSSKIKTSSTRKSSKKLRTSKVAKKLKRLGVSSGTKKRRMNLFSGSSGTKYPPRPARISVSSILSKPRILENSALESFGEWILHATASDRNFLFGYILNSDENALAFSGAINSNFHNFFVQLKQRTPVYKYNRYVSQSDSVIGDLLRDNKALCKVLNICDCINLKKHSSGLNTKFGDKILKPLGPIGQLAKIFGYGELFNVIKDFLSEHLTKEVISSIHWQIWLILIASIVGSTALWHICECNVDDDIEDAYEKP